VLFGRPSWLSGDQQQYKFDYGYLIEMNDVSKLREQILQLTREYSRQVHSGFRPAADPDRKAWQAGSTIPYAGRVFTEDEV